MIENQIKHSAGSAKTEFIKKRDAVFLAQNITHFALAFLLAKAQIFGGISPFGVGFAAASGTSPAMLFSVIGALLGYFFSGSFLWSLKYAAMCLLTVTAVYLLRDIKYFTKTWFIPLSASIMALCVGFVYAYDTGWSFSGTMLFLLDAILAGASCYFYKYALSPWPADVSDSSAEARHGVSILILCATILIFISKFTFFDLISIGRVIAVLIIMMTAFKGGVGLGAAAGAAIGLSMDAALNSGPLFCMAYAVSALISAVFSKQGRLVFMLSFILANAVSVLWTMDNYSIAALYEVFIASVIFMLIPNSVMARIGALFPSRASGYGILKAREYTRSKIELTAAAFKDLYETVKVATGEDKNDNNIATVFDLASEAVCLKCKQSTNCWRRNYESTLDVMNNLTAKMFRQGRIDASDFPVFFTEKCENLQALTSAINEELRALITRQQYNSRLRERRGAAYSQYADIAALLKGVSEELDGDMGFEPGLEHKMQKYLRSQDIEASTAIFRDRGGRLHIEISGGGLYLLKRDKNYLDKLSAVVGVRLCTPEEAEASGRITLLEAEPLTVSVGIASARRHGQYLSGDRGIFFKTDEGLFYILLSDGMGTGDYAARCSSMAVHILERFLRAGVSPEISLRILNDLLLLKNDTDTACATVDLMCIDLFTGNTKMFKFGAAPSYIRRGDTVRRLKSKAFAAGLYASSDDAPDYIKMKLEPSNLAVITSDGITGMGDDVWLREAVEQNTGSAKELARAILEKATEKFGCEDDMTVLTVAMENRK